jgi:Protein of unknown function (DUF3237)
MVIRLEKEMVYRVRVSGPLDSTAGAPLGEVQYWEMSDAWLDGSRIRARAAMPGGDWMRVGTDGYWRPNVRVQFKTDDGAVVLLHYTGLVKPSQTFTRVAREGGVTDFGDQYLRQLLRFETGDPRYLWLTQELFVAEGRLAGDGMIEYNVYRLD